jgi:hypothetical protein
MAYTTLLPLTGNITLSAGSGGSGTWLGGAYSNSNPYGTVTIANPSYTSGSGAWVTAGSSPSNALSVSGDANIKGTLTVGGKDIMDILDKIQDRLAILVPDPALLEKYEALKQAYDQYKLLEALCVEQNIPESQR